MNLATLTAYSEEWAFVDVFRQRTTWVSQVPFSSSPWNTGESVLEDAGGYPVLQPGRAAGTLMLRNLAGAYPSGRYVVTYEGDGELYFGFDAAVAARGDHRIELDVTAGNNGIYLRIDRSNPLDPVRGIHVWMPGYEDAASPFHPLFLHRLSSFSTLRFMDWQRTNNSTLEHWSDRTTIDARQSGPAGVALETMIDLANELEVDPWFCMPHLADDEFVRSFAELVLARLGPGRRVYVEWSNEAWNTVFEQAHWVRDQAAIRFGDAGAWNWVIADEALRDWDIFCDVFGCDAQRVVRVAAAQAAAQANTEKLLTRLAGNFDVLAVGAYFTHTIANLSAATTAEEILASAISYVDTTLLPRIAEHKALADLWSTLTGRYIPLVTYEGGQHITARGLDVPWQQAYYDAQTHPLMYEAYARLLLGFQSLGGGLFTAYCYVASESKWGSWGHLARQDQPASEAPKWRALLDAMAGTLPPEGAAVLVSVTRLAAQPWGLDFTVRFSGPAGLDFSFIAGCEIIVTGAGGYQQATVLGAWKLSADARLAAARLTLPSQWMPALSGTYTVLAAAGGLYSTGYAASLGTPLGTFTVWSAAGPSGLAVGQWVSAGPVELPLAT